MSSADLIEYRIAHLLDRLAREDISELGVHVDTHGSRAVLRGTVASASCRDTVLRIAAEELEGVEWQEDLTVNQSSPPDRTEELP
ncbi:BON domain-containing protein [Streptomyces sp. NPDC058662]|uniref:BON domain-containing protein n=1 Tax=Streptomyces sp. NPDC058662 TaxID=3346583 RepID=UPI0036663447